MSIKQVDRLYKKVICSTRDSKCRGTIDTTVRTELFQRIMDDLERLQKRIKRFDKGSAQHKELDAEIRQLLLKEIQIIIDDYIISQQNGTLSKWRQMYGDINHYKKSFFLYRQESAVPKRESVVNNYGFYDQDS